VPFYSKDVAVDLRRRRVGITECSTRGGAILLQPRTFQKRGNRIKSFYDTEWPKIIAPRLLADATTFPTHRHLHDLPLHNAFAPSSEFQTFYGRRITVNYRYCHVHERESTSHIIGDTVHFRPPACTPPISATEIAQLRSPVLSRVDR
jgi:hypothetical protein